VPRCISAGLSKHFLVFLASLCLLSVPGSAAGPSSASPTSGSSPILPQQFAGWQMEGSPVFSVVASSADPTNPALLNEYGFKESESATFKSDDGRTLKIRAARFADASGAFGAYTFYLRPEMVREQIGDQGASSNERVLFYRGDVLVDAVFTQTSVMSPAALRELAGMLPRPLGNSGNLPPILAYMPHHGYQTNTEKYAEGPRAAALIEAPVPAALIDFSSSPEVVLGEYSTPSGTATLMLLEYPTPAVAIEHLRRIDSAYHTAQLQPGVNAVQNVGPFFAKRSGPIIAVVSGPVSQSDAQTLLGAVNYEASVTWNENAYFDKKNNLANLLVNIILLCFIIGAISLVAGFAFGGFRVLMRRYFPGRGFGDAEKQEFIALNIQEAAIEIEGTGGGRGERRNAS
jgi:hypothetical protein